MRHCNVGPDKAPSLIEVPTRRTLPFCPSHLFLRDEHGMPVLILTEVEPGRFKLHLDSDEREVLGLEVGVGRHRLSPSKTIIRRGDEQVVVFQRDRAVFRGAQVKLRDVLFAQTAFGVCVLAFPRHSLALIPLCQPALVQGPAGRSGVWVPRHRRRQGLGCGSPLHDRRSILTTGQLVTEEDQVVATFSAGDQELPFRTITLSPSAADPTSHHALLSPQQAPTPLLERTLVAYLLYQAARANGWKDSRRPGRDETETRGPLWSTMIWAFLPRAPSWN